MHFPVKLSDEYPQLDAIEDMFDAMTDLQFAVLTWLADGKSNQEIEIIFEMSADTIEEQINSILNAMQVENRFAAAALYRYWEIQMCIY